MGIFNYNGEKFSTAINYSEETKLEATIAIDNSNIVINSIPENFSDVDTISTVCKQIEEICTNIINIPPKLNEMYLEFSRLYGDIYDLNSLSSSGLNMFKELYFDGKLSEDTLSKIKTGEIAAYELINLSNSYAFYLADHPEKFNSLFSVGGTDEYKGVKSHLNETVYDGFADEINKEMFNYLNDRNLMYTGEGVAAAGTNLVGLLGIFGWKLQYECDKGIYGSFDNNVRQGIYLGTKEDKNEELRALDCCNIYDWACRCAGVSISGRDASNKYKYSGFNSQDLNEELVVDGYTGWIPTKEENLVGPDCDYFYNAKSGDIVSNAGHMLVIVENDKAQGGYYLLESSGVSTETCGATSHVMYMSYEELANYRDGTMKITNMDLLYDNVTLVHEDHGVSNEYKTDNFFSPDEFAENLDLTPEEYAKLQIQYESRNKNPAYIDVNATSQEELETSELIVEDRGEIEDINSPITNPVIVGGSEGVYTPESTSAPIPESTSTPIPE